MLRQTIIRVNTRRLTPSSTQRIQKWLPSSHPAFARSFADKKVDDSVVPKLPSTQEENITPIDPISKPIIPSISTGSTAGAPNANANANANPSPARVLPSTPLLPAKKSSGRFRRLLLNFILVSILGYGMSVYYALNNDNWHDFFTEYIPFGEDAVAYFEEREFKRRMANKPQSETKLHSQVRGEAKVTIPSRAGASVKQVESSSDLGTKGKHSSAVDAPHPQTVQAHKTDRDPANTTVAKAAAAPEPKKVEVPVVVAAPAKHIDNLSVENATEPVVQDLVKILNDIITVINADNSSGKYSSTIDKAKGDLNKIVTDIHIIREQEKKSAEDKIKGLHTEFDTAARELVSRTEQEMKDIELRWAEEYESERARLNQAYEDKLKSEIAATNDVHERKLQNELLKQAISLREEFSGNIKSHVESERDGRLSKLDDLSSSVADLEKLTGEWTSVLSSTLSTQHLMVAVEAVRSTLESADRPRPFTAELAALKEVAENNSVVNAAIASINPTAYQKGISTSSQLIDRFRRVSSEVRKAALLPENAGVASIAASYVLSKVMFKKDGLPVGDDVESILTRTEAFLEEGNLENAVREANSLTGWAKVLSRDWLVECRRVLEVQQALDVIATEARLQSLLVD